MKSNLTELKLKMKTGNQITEDELRNLVNDLSKLDKFYKRIIFLTVNHDVLNDNAVVYPNRLGNALELVDPRWFKSER